MRKEPGINLITSLKLVFGTPKRLGAYHVGLITAFLYVVVKRLELFFQVLI